MDIQKNRIIVSAFFIFLIILFQWGCNRPRGENETYSGGYDPKDVLTVVQGDGYPDLQFPKNQLLIQTTDTTSRDQFLSLLDEIGGTLIGQIPSINTYQVRVSSKNKEELDQLKETFKGHSEIMRVAYNLIFTHAASLDVAGTKTSSKDELDQLSEAFKGRSEVLRVDHNRIAAHAGSLDFS